MQNYVVTLKSDIPTSFRTQKAADSVNLDTKKKSEHHLELAADLTTPYNVGVIVGNSGSGKTSLAKLIAGGDDFLKPILDDSRPLIDQFNPDMTYDECAAAMTGMGLTSIPCWVRPAYTLSTGQKARADAALRFSNDEKLTLIDEWTSTVDRNVAKVMSHCVQKQARAQRKTIILISCHYDVIDWLNPDWVIDCNTQTYQDRRSMVGAHKRSDQLRLEVRVCDKRSWKNFSRYHYLSAALPGGTIFTYGLFDGEKQIGFICFACYSMLDRKLYHSNRVVVHPDYVGFGLGVRMATIAAHDMVAKGFRIKAKLTSLAMVKARKGHAHWRLTAVKRMTTRKGNSVVGAIKNRDGDGGRNAAKLNYVTYYFYDFIP